jgi:hypothetical protein
MTRGASWSRGETWVYEAILFTPTGEATVIAQSEAWETSGDAEIQRARFRSLVAALGRDNWEPMPMSLGSHSGEPAHHDWYFKRQLPDA